jgi:hypothetical protein
MAWSKEYEVIVPDGTDSLARQQAFADLFQYHHETFLPAHSVTTETVSYQRVGGSNFDSHAYRCKRTMTPSGRPNVPVYEKGWMHSMQWYNTSASNVYESVFKWDGTDNPVPSNGSDYNDYYQSIYYRVDGNSRSIPQSGETRYKYYVSSEDSNTWMLFCNGFLLGYEIGDDTWWRPVDPNFYTIGIAVDVAPGIYMPSVGSTNNPWYYSSSITQSVMYGLPVYTGSYSPMSGDSNFLITDNIYLYVTREPYGSGTRAMDVPYIIGKNTRTDILLKCRNTIAMHATLSASGAESIFYNGKYYIDIYPTSSTSLLLETTADEGVL